MFKLEKTKFKVFMVLVESQSPSVYNGFLLFKPWLKDSEFSERIEPRTTVIFLQEDTSGDYQKALLYLCGGND